VRRLPFVVAAVAAALLAVGVPHARAATWCGGGEQTAVDRPDALTGAQLHVVYAYPADGGDDFGNRSAEIVGDIEAIDAWWRGQDPTRTLRFDLAAFPGCSGFGNLDLGVVKLQATSAQLSPYEGRFRLMFGEIRSALPDLGAGKKVVVYYDGPVDDPDVCGTGGGSPDTGLDSLAVIWIRSSCQDDPGQRQWVTAHEVVHELGAPSGEQPHPYGDDKGHVGDSGSDLMFPYVGDMLVNAVLDVGRDDYYRHGGSWFDLATSAWLRHLDVPQQPLTVAISGGAGSVDSDLPGVACSQTCTTQWDGGSAVSLSATPGDGERFVGWKGCDGDPCRLTLDAPKSVEAVFGPAEVRLVARVAGKGVVTGGGLACPKRCTVRVTAGGRYTLRARPSRGWRVAGWSGGGCRGTKATCSVLAEADVAVSVKLKAVKPKPKKKA